MLKTLGKTFSFRLLEPRIRKAWNLMNDCELVDIDKEYIVARFFSAEDYQKVLTEDPWMIMGHYITITKWKPNFKPSYMDVQSTLARVRFPTLPLENFDDTSLLSMGNAVGRAIKVDQNIVTTGKGRFARVCVELNLNKPLPPNVMVWGRKQPVEYEGLPKICFKCGCHGHKMGQCGVGELTDNRNKWGGSSETNRKNGIQPVWSVDASCLRTMQATVDASSDE